MIISVYQETLFKYLLSHFSLDMFLYFESDFSQIAIFMTFIKEFFIAEYFNKGRSLSSVRLCY